MNHLQQNLIAARADLLSRQDQLHRARKLGFDPHSPMIVYILRHFYRALDRVWEAQCMAEGVFR